MKNCNLIFVLAIVLAPVFLSNGQLQNMGTEVNSEYSELNPIISNGGNRLYFVVSNHPNNTKYNTGQHTQDIWYSDKDTNGVWKPRVHMPYPINTFVTNSVEATDPSGNVLILHGAFVDGKYIERGYSYSYLSKDGWSAPQKITIGDYTELDKGAFSGLALSPTLKCIIISFSENPNEKKQDLYVAFRVGLTTFSKPIPLTSLNTDFDESTPYIASDNRTLYFSSNRSGANGSSDIYMTKRIGDGWDNWTTPLNTGNLINTEEYDSYYSIDPSNKFGFIVSTANSLGKEDIFIAPVDKNFRPNNIYIVNGRLLDGISGLPINGEIVYHDLISNKEQGRGFAENNTGKYTLYLEKNMVYGIEATSNGHIGLSYYIDVKEIDSTHSSTLDLYLFPIKNGTTIPLGNLFFETGSATILPTSNNELARLTKMLKEYPIMNLKIVGYTDNIGSDKFNQKLSLKRAEAIKQYFVGQGFNEERFKTEGMGNTNPVSSNDTEQGRSKNRRVEITISNL